MRRMYMCLAMWETKRVVAHVSPSGSNQTHRDDYLMPVSVSVSISFISHTISGVDCLHGASSVGSLYAIFGCIACYLATNATHPCSCLPYDMGFENAMRSATSCPKGQWSRGAGEGTWPRGIGLTISGDRAPSPKWSKAVTTSHIHFHAAR